MNSGRMVRLIPGKTAHLIPDSLVRELCLRKDIKEVIELKKAPKKKPVKKQRKKPQANKPKKLEEENVVTE